MLQLADILFVIFHTALITFNLFGWIWKWSRKYNLLTLALTGSSWLFLGIIYNTPGYCPLTDWHFNILRKLGETNLPYSYIKYLVDRLTGMDLDAVLVDNLTLWGFVAALIISLTLNLRDAVKGRKGMRNT